MVPIRVDLPAPFPPASATISPVPDLEADLAEHGERAEALGEPADFEQGGPAGGSADRLHQLTSVSVVTHGRPGSGAGFRPCP